MATTIKTNRHLFPCMYVLEISSLSFSMTEGSRRRLRQLASHKFGLVALVTMMVGRGRDTNAECVSVRDIHVHSPMLEKYFFAASTSSFHKNDICYECKRIEQGEDAETLCSFGEKSASAGNAYSPESIASSLSSFTIADEASINTTKKSVACCLVKTSLNSNDRHQKNVSFALEAPVDANKAHGRCGHWDNTTALTSFVDPPIIHSQAWVSDLWYESQDFERFHYQAQLEAATIQWTPEKKWYLDALNESHSIAARLSAKITKASKKHKNEEAFLWSRIFQRIDVPETGLAQWCFTPYRGLERHASLQLRHSKFSARIKMRNELLRSPAIVGCESSSLEEDDAVDTTSTINRFVSPDELATRIQRRSQASRLFARMLGMADELAARHANQTRVSSEECYY